MNASNICKKMIRVCTNFCPIFGIRHSGVHICVANFAAVIFIHDIFKRGTQRCCLSCPYRLDFLKLVWYNGIIKIIRLDGD